MREQRRFTTLDGRRKLIVMRDGVEGVVFRYSRECSGCTPGYEESGSSLNKGLGCHECGYSGLRRVTEWWPLEEAKEFEYND